MSWPAAFTGMVLQGQTNPLTIGLRTNWVDIVGSTASNGFSVPISTNTNSAVFYRLSPQ